MTGKPQYLLTVRLLVVVAACPPPFLNRMNLNPSLRKYTSVSPAEFYFYPNDTRTLSLTREFIIHKYAGCFQLVATAVNRDPFKRDYYQNSSTMFYIVDTGKNVLPAPMMSEVVFSNDGFQLLIQFTYATNQPRFTLNSFGNGFNCSNLFVFAGAIHSTCVWGSASSVIAFTSLIEYPNLGDSISLLPGHISAACYDLSWCGSNPTSSIIQTLQIGSPSNPIAPGVSLQASSIIGSCSNLLLDATASTGNGGRPWSEIRWTVYSYTLASDGTQISAIAATEIENFLYKNYQSTANISRAVIIPNYLLSVGQQYSISLTLVNFLNVSGSRIALVKVKDTPTVLDVHILGFKQITIFPNNSLQLFCSASYSTPCNSSQHLKTSKISYSWYVFLGINYISSIKSNSQDPREFSLSPYSLELGSVYTVQCKGSLPGASSGQMYSDSVSVQVASTSTIKAIISNGNQIVASPSSNIVIDASASYDVDYPNQEQNFLTYAWKCIQLSSNAYGSSCIGFNSSFSSMSQLHQTPFSLLPNTYYFSVVVSNRFSGVSAVTSITLVVLTNDAPKVELPSHPGIVKFNSQVVLYGSITASNITTVNWTMPYPSSLYGYDLQSLTAVPLGQVVGIGKSKVLLPLYFGCLTAGMTYTFSLSAQYSRMSNASDKAVASSTITFTVNQPPLGGILDIEPSMGYALKTSFSFYTSSWIGSTNNLPFKFSYLYYLQCCYSVYMIKTSSLLLSVSTVLPSGLQSSGHIVWGVATATDVWGDSSNVTKAVTVLPSSIPYSSIASALENVTSSVLNGLMPLETIYQYSSAAISTVNNVDCSRVPQPCSSLYRAQCYSVPNTCGSCLLGYVGIDGDANFPCVPSTPFTLSASRFLRKMSNGVEGDSCVSGNECLSGNCSSSFNASGVCLPSAKTCVNNCNQLGQCRYYKNSVQISQCDFSDNFCHAVCSCYSGYFGQDCSLNSSQSFIQKQNLRVSLCSTVSNVFAVQHRTLEVISSTLQSIAGIVNGDGSQLINSAMFTCGEVLFSIIDSDTQLICSSEGYASTASTILRIFNSFSSSINGLIGSQRSEYFSSFVFYLARWIAACRSQGAVLGEPKVSTFLNSLTVSGTLYNTNYYHTNHILLPSARSTTETISNEPSSAIVSFTDLFSTIGKSVNYCNNIGLSVFQFPFDPEGILQVSRVAATAVYLDRYAEPCSESQLSTESSFQSQAKAHQTVAPTAQPTYLYEKETDILVTMNFFSPVEFGSLIATSIEIFCNKSNIPVNFNSSCMQTFRAVSKDLHHNASTIYTRLFNYRNVSVTCPVNKVGYFTVNCPGYFVQPVCRSFDGSSYVNDSTCSVVAFNENNATCKCKLRHSNSSLLVSNLYTVEGRFAVSVSEDVTESYSVSYTELGRPIQRESSIVILAVSLSIVAAYIIGSLVTFKVDGDSTHKKKRMMTFSLVKPRFIDSFFESIMPADFKFQNFEELLNSRLTKEHTILSMLCGSNNNDSPQSRKFLSTWLYFIGNDLLILLYRILIIMM